MSIHTYKNHCKRTSLSPLKVMSSRYMNIYFSLNDN
jgi:hypothetical protein